MDFYGMCTLVMLRRPDAPWPLIMAANRDEMADRPWKAPGRWWDDRPEIRAGLDELAGGSWFGMNDTGVMAAILNRFGTLGPAPGKRSRGELVLEALDHADAVDAAHALAGLEARSYRPFNMILADNRDAFWLRADGETIAAHPIPPGLHMISALELDDTRSPRIRAYLDRFRQAPPPRPDPDRADGGDWAAWQALMSDTGALAAEGEEETAAMCFLRSNGFGTVSGTLLALPAIAASPMPAVWRFAHGRPDKSEYAAVAP